MITLRTMAVAGLLALTAQLAVAQTPEAPPSAAEQVVADWNEVLLERFRTLAAQDEAAFIAAWDAERQRWAARLAEAEQEDGVPAERERVILQYEWAFGRLYYPEWHAGLTEQPDFTPSATYDAFYNELELDRPDLLDIDEYAAFLSRIAALQADAMFDDRANTLSGDTQYLDARLHAASGFDHPEIRCFLEADALSYWLEDFDADGLTTQVDDHAARCPGDRADGLLEQLQTERAERDGHVIEIFKTVDGHALELHIYTPEDWTPGDDLRPTVLWSHGGGWAFGSWNWCGPCRFFKERGMVVAQVEYRLRNRHGTNADHALSDVTDALIWLRDNGAQYGVDPQRIASSGFSAGAHLSVAAAVLEPEGSPARPDLTVSFSGCMDMTDDGYMIDKAGGYAAARAISPLHALTGPTPPLYLVNADRDEDCAFETAQAFVEAARAQGSDVTFQEVRDAGHFFLRDPARATETQARVNAFLDEQGF